MSVCSGIDVDVDAMLYLVYFGLDDEELDERGRAVDGGVDVLQGLAGLAHIVKVLCQEELDPQQGGGGLLSTVIYHRHMTSSINTQTPP